MLTLQEFTAAFSAIDRESQRRIIIVAAFLAGGGTLADEVRSAAALGGEALDQWIDRFDEEHGYS